MRGRLLLMCVAGAGAAMLAAAPVAAQTPYPPTEPVLTVSATTVVVGSIVTVEGTGYEPGEAIAITVETTPIAAPGPAADDPAGPALAMVPVARAVPVVAGPAAAQLAAARDKKVRADADGGFTARVKLTEVGRAVITATGKESGRSASAVVTVVSSAEELPETGGSAWSLARVGGATIVLGAVLLVGSLLWRRSRAA